MHIILSIMLIVLFSCKDEAKKNTQLNVNQKDKSKKEFKEDFSSLDKKTIIYEKDNNLKEKSDKAIISKENTKNIIKKPIADIFVVQFHFEREGDNSLDKFYELILKMKNNLGKDKLPEKILWRVVAPKLRGDTLFRLSEELLKDKNNSCSKDICQGATKARSSKPSMSENLKTMKKIQDLYKSLNLSLEFALYFDQGYSWSCCSWGDAAFANGFDLNVKGVYSDFLNWQESAKKYQISLNEIVIESEGAKSKIEPVISGESWEYSVLDAIHKKNKEVKLSLIPEFSFVKRMCINNNPKDICEIVIETKGSFYLQIYNLYSKKPDNNVFLWDVAPKKTNIIKQCSKSDPVCLPKLGSSIYANKSKWPARRAGEHVAKILYPYIKERCDDVSNDRLKGSVDGFFRVFKFIFSYEKYATSVDKEGSRLMGHIPYSKSDFLDFKLAFKNNLFNFLKKNKGGLCKNLKTLNSLEGSLQTGVYWPRKAVRSWLSEDNL